MKRIICMFIFLMLVLINVGCTKKNSDVGVVNISSSVTTNSAIENIKVNAFMQESITVAIKETVSLINCNICPSSLKDKEISFKWECDIGEVNEYGITFTPKLSDIGQHKAILKIYKTSTLVNTLTTNIIVVDSTINKPIDVLCIGDSLSNAKAWETTLENKENITLVGTKYSTYSDGSTSPRHEGVSGASAADYLKSTGTILGNTDAFYNPETSAAFDYEYYKSSTGFNPDAVILFLGTNGASENPTENANNIISMVNKIKKADSDVQIYVVHTICSGSKTFNDSVVAYNLFSYMNPLLQGVDNVYTIPLQTTNNTLTRFDSSDTIHPVNYNDFSSIIYSALCANN